MLKYQLQSEITKYKKAKFDTQFYFDELRYVYDYMKNMKIEYQKSKNQIKIN